MSFQVTGIFGSGERSQTRGRPGGAILLAERYQNDGADQVRIAWNGSTFDLDAFRAQFRLTRDGWKAQQTIPIAAEG